MDKLALVIDKINHLLLIVIDKLLALISKWTPVKIKNFINQTKEKIEHKKAVVENRIENSKNKIKEKSLEKINFVKTYPIKEMVDQVKDRGLLLSKKVFTKAFLLSLLVSLLASLKSLKVYLTKYSFKQIAFSFSLLAVTAIGGVKLYFTGKEIVERSQKREPASVEKKFGVRPPYYKGEQKITVVSEISMPVYFHLKGSQNRVLFDLTLKLSNRALVQFINKHEFEIKDYINSNVEPFTPDFPLTEEGKIIIKEKVLFEINRYIKEKKAEGELLEVYINNMISG